MKTPTSLAELLERDEGRVAHAYQDSLGFWTIGVGHLIDKRRGGGLPEPIIDALLEWDINHKTRDVFKAFPWATTLDDVRLDVLVSMAFQLGIEGLSKFKRALAAMERGDWEAAATNFLDSKVAREQAPARWKRFAKMIRTGNYV